MDTPEKVEFVDEKRSKIFDRLNKILTEDKRLTEDVTTSPDLMPSIRRGTRRLREIATDAFFLDPQDILRDLKRSLKP
jgi:hypothetical protein